jgi:hypothetical protein
MVLAERKMLLEKGRRETTDLMKKRGPKSSSMALC